MDNLSLEGIVIRTIHYNESSEIVHLYTKHGNISVMAKGARKYKSHKLAFCQPLTKVKVIISNSSLPTLIDYSIVDNYDSIKEDLKKNLWCQYLLEIINKLPDKTYFEQIYHMLDSALDKIKDYDPMLIVLICQTKLLKAYGVEPNWNECSICQGKNIKFFSISSGGFICDKHNVSDKEDLKPYLDLKRMYYFNLYEDDLNKLSDVDLSKVFMTLTKYYEYHVEIKLHSLSTLII